jgi:hypothetical protein
LILSLPHNSFPSHRTYVRVLPIVERGFLWNLRIVVLALYIIFADGHIFNWILVPKHLFLILAFLCISFSSHWTYVRVHSIIQCSLHENHPIIASSLYIIFDSAHVF